MPNPREKVNDNKAQLENTFRAGHRKVDDVAPNDGARSLRSFDTGRLKAHIKALHQHCAAEQFQGYSLYDSHNSPIPFAKLGAKGSFLVNQAVKRSPFNLRRILKVQKGVNPKGVGLFLNAYATLHGGGVFDQFLTARMLDEKCAWLRDNSSEKYSGYCWGYNYDWPRRDGSVIPAHTPNVVVTAFICRALMAYYEISGEASARQMIESAGEFVKNDVYCTTGTTGRCYSYTPLQRDLVINANLLAAEILAYADVLSGKADNWTLVEEVLQFTLEHQNDDGSWFYSLSPETGKPKKQIDFHQGYVLDSIDILRSIYACNTESCQHAIEKGLKFYFENQFHADGYAYWRVPRVWPVDIHNQSQGIITLCRFAGEGERYLDLAISVYNWTIDNMRSTGGRFYYQKYPYFTNKTDYLRWNQGWMMVAMATLLKTMGKGGAGTV